MASRRPARHGDLGDALELAGKLAARSGDAQVLVATDGALATPATATVPAKITVLPVGRERKNQAIVAMAVRTAPSAVTRSVFVSVGPVFRRLGFRTASEIDYERYARKALRGDFAEISRERNRGPQKVADKALRAAEA